MCTLKPGVIAERGFSESGTGCKRRTWLIWYSKPLPNTLLSKVVNASVDLSNEDEFDQVRSGLIILRGRLSIAIMCQALREKAHIHTTR